MKKQIFLLIAIISILCSCSKDTCSDGIKNGNETSVDCGGDCAPCISGKNMEGYAQKGPFLNGSSITLSELNNSLTPTGNDFNTQIIDNSGSYFINGVSLSSNYAAITINGFYFNEVCGANSNTQITLNSIVDASDNNELNINILTHLEKRRVEYLVSNGTTFQNAKTQAQNEILSIFNITPAGNSISSSELLDISNDAEGDAILIAVSSILQGYRSESELSDLMANIITDVRTDGVLNSENIGSSLLAHALLLDTVEIKNNIETRYSNLGITLNTPNFGQYISNFITNNSFVNNTSVIDYPVSANYGINILDLNNTTYINDVDYSLSANLPVDCLTLKVTITKAGASGIWFYSSGSEQNWSISNYNSDNDSQTFITTGTTCDLDVIFEQGTYLIEYFESSSAIATKSKTITVN